jgi:hypothetical protein
MSYNKPELKLLLAIKMVQSRNFKMDPILPDAFGFPFPFVTSSAYEADE